MNSTNYSTGVFVPLKGAYVMDPNAPASASFNEIGEYFGYHPDQLYFYLGNYDVGDDIYGVGYEYLTDKIIFVSTKSHVHDLSNSKVKEYTKGFDQEIEYDRPAVTEHLKEAVQNKSFTSQFVSRFLNVPIDDDSIIDAPLIGMYLYFNNGVLTDFQSSDGFNEWAKHLRQLNPKWMKAFERVAQKYWGNDVRRIIQELNLQASAYADLHDGLKNPYLQLHEAEEGTFNFRMLLVTHYSSPLALDQFKTINHGRYENIQDKVDSGLQKYIVGKFLYEFDVDGALVNFLQMRK